MKLDFECETKDSKKIQINELSLTDMEHAILEFLIRNKSKEYLPKQISSELFISIETLQRSLKSLLSKELIEARQETVENKSHVLHYKARPKSKLKKNTTAKPVRRANRFTPGPIDW